LKGSRFHNGTIEVEFNVKKTRNRGALDWRVEIIAKRHHGNGI